MMLDGAHPHLLVNHVPVVLAPCALALMLAGLAFRSRHLERAGLVACIVVAISAIASYGTGGTAEGAVHGLPGVTGPAIEEHARAGTFALMISILVGILALPALFLSLRRPVTPKLALAAVTIVLAFSVTVLARAAYLGGQVRHSEIRP